MKFTEFEMRKRKSDGNVTKASCKGTVKRMAYKQRKRARLFAVNSTKRGTWFPFSTQQMKINVTKKWNKRRKQSLK